MSLLLLLRPHGPSAARAPTLDEPLGTTGYPRHRSTTLGVFTIQQTDTHPLVACQLKQGVGTADEAVIDLTNADSVTFRMRALGATTDTVSAAATIVAAAFAWERALTGSEFAAHYADPFCFLTEA